MEGGECCSHLLAKPSLGVFKVLCYEAIKGHLVSRPSTAPLPGTALLADSWRLIESNWPKTRVSCNPHPSAVFDMWLGCGWCGAEEEAKPVLSPPSPSLSMPLPMEARHLLAGGLAGVAANAMLHPLDTVRARVTVHQHVSRLSDMS